ncbi:MAG: hypothetical protein ACM3O7_05105 [Acidobacteriota bacterium]
MPHVVRRGRVDLEAAWRQLPRGPWRWGTAVAKVEGCFLSSNAGALLVAGVVVEYGRPLHPVIIVSFRDDDTAVHLWSHAAVERTQAVKRLLVQVAADLAPFGAGEIVTTNLADLTV